MDVVFSILWGAWNADDFVGNLGISGEFFTMFSTGLVELLQVFNWHSHWQKPATSVLRSPRESYDSGSSRYKIKRTWAFLIFLALKMWLTWYQIVDHVCYSQSNMAKGMCSINDSLNTKVSPFFDTPFPSSYWLMGTKSTSSIKHAYQALSQNSIGLHPHGLRKDSIDKVRYRKLLSHYTRSIGTSRNMYLIYLPIRSLSFNLMARGFFERVQCSLQPSLIWTDSSATQRANFEIL